MGAELNTDKATPYAYRLLAVRPLSEKEFRTKLKDKGFSSAIVEAAAARFRELGYLNDESVARQWARSLAVNRLWGNRRIEMSLREKGIARELIADAISLAREEITEREAAVQLLVKKGKGEKVHPEDSREKRRLMQSLMGKGFPPGLIFEILSLSGEEEVHDGE
jgi:regulatory protein